MLSVDDAKVVARDSKLPGLVALLDNELALRLFQKYLGHPFPQSARCTYLRYKPGVSCLAAFTLDTSKGKQTVYATAYRVDAADKLEKANRDTHGLEPIAIPGLAIVVSPFPCDSELPALERTFSPEGRQQLLARLIPDDDNLHSAQWKELRYKPERRYVARLDVEDQPRAVLKLHSEKSYAQARRAAKSLGANMEIITARVLGHSDRHRAILVEWLEGKTLQSLFEDTPQANAAMEAVGRLLAQLHALPICKLPQRSTEREAQELQRLAEDFEAVSPALAEPMRIVAQRCSEGMKPLSELAVPLHGDFHPQQIIVKGLETQMNAALIDFDSAALGHPASDVGNMLAHLEREALQGRLDLKTRDQFSEALVSAYAKQHRPLDHHAVQIYLAASLLRLAHEPFRYRHANWHDETETIVKRAIEILDGIVEERSTTSINTKRENQFVIDDGALPTAAKALDSHFASESIAPIIRQAFQDDSLEIQAIRVLRDKPGRRCLIEYFCKGADAQNDVIVLGKIHAKRRHERSLRMQRSLWENGFDYESGDGRDGIDDGISVARPIGVVPECQMWLQERVPGTSCWDALSGPDSHAVAIRIADAAHKLHQAGIRTDRVHTIDDELRILEEKLPQVARHLPQYKSRIDTVLDACRELTASIPSTPPTGIHRDFYPDQVLVDGDRIYVLDHDLYCLGDPCLDIGNFCGHLIEHSLRLKGHPNSYAESQDQLVERFCSLREDCNPTAIDAYTTLTLARHIYLSTRIAGRHSSTSLVLTHCEHALSGLLA